MNPCLLTLVSYPLNVYLSFTPRPLYLLCFMIFLVRKSVISFLEIQVIFLVHKFPVPPKRLSRSTCTQVRFNLFVVSLEKTGFIFSTSICLSHSYHPGNLLQFILLIFLLNFVYWHIKCRWFHWFDRSERLFCGFLLKRTLELIVNNSFSFIAMAFSFLSFLITP